MNIKEKIKYLNIHICFLIQTLMVLKPLCQLDHLMKLRSNYEHIEKFYIFKQKLQQVTTLINIMRNKILVLMLARTTEIQIKLKIQTI